MSGDGIGTTVGDVHRRGGSLRVTCGSCGHVASVDPGGLRIRHVRRRLSRLPMRCARCGAPAATVEAVYPAPAPTPAARIEDSAGGVRALYVNGNALSMVCGRCFPGREVAYTVGEIERQTNAVDPSVRLAVSRLRCPRCQRPSFIGVGRAGQRERVEAKPPDRRAGKWLE